MPTSNPHGAPLSPHLGLSGEWKPLSGISPDGVSQNKREFVILSRRRRISKMLRFQLYAVIEKQSSYEKKDGGDTANH
jgi:hypothetical protein